MCCGGSNFALSFVHDRALFEELERMADHDNRVRAELLATGELFHGYHPRMEAVHKANARRLKQIIAERGWPGRSLVGDEGATYAWLIVQHSIGDPAFQRSCLVLLIEAVANRDAPASHVAYLEDRIRTFEGRPQLYGTQFDRDRNGQINPLPIEDPDRVNERRRAIGLDNIEDRIRMMRAQAEKEQKGPTQDYEQRQREFENWAHRVGWRP
jgi:hypothetical protein